MYLSKQAGLVPNEKVREHCAHVPARMAAYPIVNNPKIRINWLQPSGGLREDELPLQEGQDGPGA